MLYTSIFHELTCYAIFHFYFKQLNSNEIQKSAQYKSNKKTVGMEKGKKKHKLQKPHSNKIDKFKVSITFWIKQNSFEMKKMMLLTVQIKLLATL